MAADVIIVDCSHCCDDSWDSALSLLNCLRCKTGSLVKSTGTGRVFYCTLWRIQLLISKLQARSQKCQRGAGSRIEAPKGVGSPQPTGGASWAPQRGPRRSPQTNLVHVKHERTTPVALRIAYYGKLIIGNFFVILACKQLGKLLNVNNLTEVLTVDIIKTKTNTKSGITAIVHSSWTLAAVH